MSTPWNKQTATTKNPLAAYHGKPLISQVAAGQTYLGRLIVEMWDDGSAQDDSYKLALSCWAQSGNYADLTRRISAALPVRVQRDAASSVPLPPLPAAGPLADYHSQPMISGGAPPQHYIGRLLIELIDDGSARDDSYKLVLASDPVDGNHLAFRQRIATALPGRVLRTAPFEAASNQKM